MKTKATETTLEMVREMSDETIATLTGTKAIMLTFGLGLNGRKVTLPEIQQFTQEERNLFADECKQNFVANCEA